MDKVERTTEWLQRKLAYMIDLEASRGYGITKRKLRQRLPSSLGPAVESMLQAWAAQGVIIFTGTGKKGSPVVVSRADLKERNNGTLQQAS